MCIPCISPPFTGPKTFDTNSDMLAQRAFRAPTRSAAAPARVTVRARATQMSKGQLETVVHRFFDVLNAETHAVEEIASSDIKLFDHTNQACYHGFAAIKHRMQSVHDSLPVVQEVADVVDAGHSCVAAHYVAQSKAGRQVSGSFTFRFDDAGKIVEVVSYQDADEEEFLEA